MQQKWGWWLVWHMNFSLSHYPQSIINTQSACSLMAAALMSDPQMNQLSTSSFSSVTSIPAISLKLSVQDNPGYELNADRYRRCQSHCSKWVHPSVSPPLSHEGTEDMQQPITNLFPPPLLFTVWLLCSSCYSVLGKHKKQPLKGRQGKHRTCCSAQVNNCSFFAIQQ